MSFSLSVFGVAIGCMCAGQAYAEDVQPFPTQNGVYWTGDALYSVCTSQSREGRIMCNEYVMAASDAFDYANTVLLQKRMFCYPRGYNLSQLSDVVKKFIENNPARRAEMAPALIYESLFEAFPCKP